MVYGMLLASACKRFWGWFGILDCEQRGVHGDVVPCATALVIAWLWCIGFGEVYRVVP